jgi:uncharacterized membrane protein YhdT
LEEGSTRKIENYKSSRFKDISFVQAQKVITKDYLEKEASNPIGKVAKPWVFSILFSIFFILGSLLIREVNGRQSIPFYVLIYFVLPVNLIIALLMILIRKKELTYFKKSLATSFILIYIGILMFILILISEISRVIIDKGWLELVFYIFLCFIFLGIVIYSYRNSIHGNYEKYGLSYHKSKFNQIYRKVTLVIFIVGIVLAYLFRNVPGSHGSTAPQWLQIMGIIGACIVIVLIPTMFFMNDIIKGLLIRKYYNEFREVYEPKKENERNAE